MTQKAQLQEEIQQMEAVYNDADTPQDVKDLLKEPLANARKMLADLEEKQEEKKTVPAPVKAKAVKVTKAAKKVVQQAKKAVKSKSSTKAKSLKDLVKSSAVLKKLYAGKSEKALKRDAGRKAKPAGSRVSASGNEYREYRANRTDARETEPYLEGGGEINDVAYKIGDKVYWLGEDGAISFGKVTDTAVTKNGQFVWVNYDVAFKPDELHLISKSPDKFKKDDVIETDQTNDEIWHHVGLNQPPDNFTPAATQAFEKAIADLQIDKSNEHYYKTASAAMATLVTMVNSILHTGMTATTAHQQLQEIGIHNYRTGLLLDTSFLNRELAERHLAKGGAIGEKTWIVNIAMPAEKGTKLRKEEIVLGPKSDKFDVQQAIKRKGPDWLGNGRVLSIVEKHAKGGQLSIAAKEICNSSGKALVVHCKSAGNPDHRQNPDEEISPAKFFAVNSLKEASQKCRQYIEDWDLGMGNWTGGQVYDIDGKVIAYVSYNGRVWKQDPAEFRSAKGNNEITGKELADNYYKKGGATRNLSRDRKFKSQEPHEQKYKRKTSPKNPTYKHAAGGKLEKGQTVTIDAVKLNYQIKQATERNDKKVIAYLKELQDVSNETGVFEYKVNQSVAKVKFGSKSMNVPIDMILGLSYAKGGATRNLSRDRKFKSQEPHEQRYKRKTSPRNPTYGKKRLMNKFLKKK